MSDRACTCHPDEAPKPCQKRYAFSECQADRIAQLEAELAQCQNTLYRQIGLTIQASEDATKASADRIAQLEAALQRIDKMEVYEADAAVVLWAKIGIMRDIARAALEERT